MSNPRRGATDIIDAEVRELIRRRGVDPFQDPAAARRLIDEVMADYRERALAGALPVLADPTAVAKQVFDGVAGLGPLQRFMDDPTVEEIWVNGPGRVFVARGGRSELTTAILSHEQLVELCERMLKNTGRRVDLSTPFVDAGLPDGSRLHIAIPDITRDHWAVNIRKFVVRATALEELVALGTVTQHAARFLESCIVAGLNVVVAGGTQAGKTTLLNCLANTIPATERVISCEEVFELKLALPDWVAMQTRQANLEGRGSIELRRLVIEALRMRPSRIIVGEVRQAECLDLLIALNSGLPGMCSIHASSAREAITKLCTLPLLAGENISSAFVVPTVASSVDIVVHTETSVTGQRRISEIVGVSGRVEGTTIEVSDLFTTRSSRLVRAEGFPPHPERFARVGIDIPGLLSGALGTQRPAPVRRDPNWRPSLPGETTDTHAVLGSPLRGSDDEQATMMTAFLAAERGPNTQVIPALSAPPDAGPNHSPGPYPPRLSPRPRPRPTVPPTPENAE